MSVRIEETDFGTKDATYKALDRLIKENPSKLDLYLLRYFIEVYKYALKFCPVDTGALRASIRIRRGQQKLAPYTKAVGKRTGDHSFYITAGGEVINPKHKKLVDYAMAVHDGYMAGGRWVPGRPFLLQAITAAEKDFADNVNKYLDWVEKVWSSDAIKTIPSKLYSTQPIKGLEEQ